MSEIKIKCVGFDADNTLYKTKEAAKGADMAAMRALAPEANASPEELYEKFLEIVRGIKNSRDPLVRHRRYSYGKLCALFGADSAMVEKMYQAFAAELLAKIEKIEGVEKVLENLSARGIKMFVITEDNKLKTEKKLESLRLAKYFSGITSSDDTKIMKPDVSYYEMLMKACEPAETLVVGDSLEKDLALPRDLGMNILLVEKPEDLRKIAADFFAH